MPKPDPVTPCRFHLESIAKKAQVVDYMLIGVLVPLDAWLIWRLLTAGDGGLLVVSLVFLGMSSIIHLAGVFQLFTVRGRRVKYLRLPEAVGRYSASAIKRMVAELSKPHTGRERPAIFITESRYAGAFAVNSLFFNLIKPLNAVYISRYLFQILTPGEVKAILAHELAHFYKYQRPLSRTRLALLVLNALLPVQLFNLSPRAAIFAWCLFSYVLIRVLPHWFIRHARTYEFLSDLHAARRYGILNTINGLLGVSKTAEIQYIIHSKLLRAIRDDDTLSIRQLPRLFELIDQALPVQPVSRQDIERAIVRVLASSQTRSLRRALTADKKVVEKCRIELVIEGFLMNKTFDLLDWGTFDKAPRDGRVDEDEYPSLIRILKEKKGRQLFALPTDNERVVRRGSHPTICERVLFLDKCRREDGTLSLNEPTSLT